MSGRIKVAAVVFPAFLTEFGCVHRASSRSFLVQNWCAYLVKIFPSAPESRDGYKVSAACMNSIPITCEGSILIASNAIRSLNSFAFFNATPLLNLPGHPIALWKFGYVPERVRSAADHRKT
jgi:hypothetical protein